MSDEDLGTPAKLVDPAKIAKAHEIYEKTVASLEKAKANEQAALKQLRDLGGSTFVVGVQHYQVRERKDTGLHICKLEGAPKGRPKGPRLAKPAGEKPPVRLEPYVVPAANAADGIVEKAVEVTGVSENESVEEPTSAG